MSVLLAVLWPILCLGFTLALIPRCFSDTAPLPFQRPLPTVPTVIAVALIVRLCPAVFLWHGDNWDLNSYRLVGSLVLHGQSVYSERAITDSAANHYPYLPAQLWLSAFALWANAHLHLPFVVLAKLPPILADSAIAGTITVGLRRHGQPDMRARTCGLLYAMNPVTVLIASYHGQFDALPLLGCMVAWALPLDERPSVPAALWAGVALGFAIALKTWPALLLPVYVLAVRPWRCRGLMVAAALGVPLLITLAYSTCLGVPLSLIARTVVSYGGVPWQWGIGLALGAMQSHVLSVAATLTLAGFMKVAIIGTVGTYLLLYRPRSIPMASVIVLTLFYVLTAGFGPQYLAWIVPFAVSAVPDVPPRLVLWFAISSTFALMVDSLGPALPLPAPSGSLFVSLMVLVYLVLLTGLVYALVRRRPAPQSQLVARTTHA